MVERTTLFQRALLLLFKCFFSSLLSIYIRTVSSQCLLFALLSWFKLVFGLFRHALYAQFLPRLSSQEGLFVCFKGRITPLPDKLNPYLQSSHVGQGREPPPHRRGVLEASAQSQEGIECTKAKELLRSYRLIYILCSLLNFPSQILEKPQPCGHFDYIVSKLF